MTYWGKFAETGLFGKLCLVGHYWGRFAREDLLGKVCLHRFAGLDLLRQVRSSG